MDNICIIIEYSLNESNGSILRVKRQVEGLKNNNLNNVSIIDNFNKNSVKPKDSLIHAQQLTGRFFEKKTYIADIHGISYEEMGTNLFHQNYLLRKNLVFIQVKKNH